MQKLDASSLGFEIGSNPRLIWARAAIHIE